MPCIKFEMEESGKATIEGRSLNLVRLLKYKYYLVDDKFLEIIKNYSGQIPQEEIVYNVISWVAKRDQGLAARISAGELEDVVKDIKGYDFIINPN